LQAPSPTVGAEVRVEPLDAREARVLVPFEFPDGDRLVIRLRQHSDADFEWTDTGHTFMHLSYDLDIDALESGNRKSLLESIEQRAGIEERSGELVLPTARMSSPATFFSSSRPCCRSATCAFSRASG
jgi:hypothetical protein